MTYKINNDCLTTDELTAELNAFCEKHSLPQMSADELRAELGWSRGESDAFTPDQIDEFIEWLDDFSERWEAATDEPQDCDPASEIDLSTEDIEVPTELEFLEHINGRRDHDLEIAASGEDADPDCPICGWGAVGCAHADSGCRKTGRTTGESIWLATAKEIREVN